MTITRQAGERNSVTRDRLLDVSARLFREKGFAATTIREIAHATGFKSASIYYHMVDKGELLFVICRQALLDVIEAVEQVASADAPMIERCEQLIRTHLNVMLGERDRHAVMLAEMKSLSSGRLTELLALRDQYESNVRGVLSEAVEAKDLRSDIPVPTLSRLLLGLMNWPVFWFNPEGSLSADDLSYVVIDLFLNGASDGVR